MLVTQLRERLTQVENRFDVIVVGAGINGAGIARDAALRGLNVLLLDKNDLASGTSSGSTRLIHGGLRYLEHGELSLVRESLREREVLLRIAPHLVKPLPLLVPIYRDGRRRKATIRAGLITYDLLSTGKSLPRHRMLSARTAIARAPALNPEQLKGAALYYDAQVEFAERLVLENVLAAHEAGATIAAYARVEEFVSDNDRVAGVRFVEVQTGQRHVVHGRFVVNAAGPWVDELLGKGAFDKPLIGGTRGSHIVVRPIPGAGDAAIYSEAKSDSRPFFIIPWNGNVLIGTTDTRFKGDLDSVTCDPWEIDYLLAETNRVLPSAKLKSSDVLFTFSGVRPLASSADETEEKITRHHFISMHPRLVNLMSIVGGKLTTYRSLAEECVDLVCAKLGGDFAQGITARLQLPGAVERSDEEQHLGAGWLSVQTAQRLRRVYGARTADVLALAGEAEELRQTFNQRNDALAAEVVFSFQHEFASTITDCLMRRTMLGLNGDMALDDVESAARVAQKFLGWSSERVALEVANYRAYVKRFLFPRTF